MKKRKKSLKVQKNQKLSNTLVYSLGISILFVSIFIAVSATRQEQNFDGNAQSAPTNIIPTFGSLGDCQANNSCPPGGASPVVTEPAISPQPVNPVTSPGQPPCVAPQVKVKTMNHSLNDSGRGGFFQLILQFFQQLLQLLLQLLGGNGTPPATPPPGNTIQPSQGVQPSQAPSMFPAPCPPVRQLTPTITLPIAQPTINQPAPTINTVSPSTSPPGVSNGYVPAGTDNCGNAGYTKYIAMTPPKKNFGDPLCDFTKDKLYTFLKQTDPAHADIWFLTIVPGESGYDPNAFASPSNAVQCSLDCGGAWGLYQMGSSSPPEQAPPAPGKNGVFDRGDVNWELQTQNAIQYNTTVLRCNFRYWATARSIWGKYSC